MTTLCPQARAFVDSAQSAALSQNHRARIWVQLQQRAAESPSHSAPWRGRVSRVPLGWGSCIASLALIAGVLGAVHRRSTSASVNSLNTCPLVLAPSCEACLAPPVLAPSCEACLLPSVIETRSPQTPSPASLGVSKHVASSRTKAKHRAPQPVTRSDSSSKRLDPAQLVPERLVAVLPAYGRAPLEHRRERQIPADPGSTGVRAASYGGALPFGVTTEWLEIALPSVAAAAPLVEGRFEPAWPLKLTPPQLRLTATLLE